MTSLTDDDTYLTIRRGLLVEGSLEVTGELITTTKFGYDLDPPVPVVTTGSQTTSSVVHDLSVPEQTVLGYPGIRLPHIDRLEVQYNDITVYVTSAHLLQSVTYQTTGVAPTDGSTYDAEESGIDGYLVLSGLQVDSLFSFDVLYKYVNDERATSSSTVHSSAILEPGTPSVILDVARTVQTYDTTVGWTRPVYAEEAELSVGTINDYLIVLEELYSASSSTAPSFSDANTTDTYYVLGVYPDGSTPRVRPGSVYSMTISASSVTNPGNYGVTHTETLYDEMDYSKMTRGIDVTTVNLENELANSPSGATDVSLVAVTAPVHSTGTIWNVTDARTSEEPRPEDSTSTEEYFRIDIDVTSGAESTSWVASAKPSDTEGILHTETGTLSTITVSNIATDAAASGAYEDRGFYRTCDFSVSVSASADPFTLTAGVDVWQVSEWTGTTSGVTQSDLGSRVLTTNGTTTTPLVETFYVDDISTGPVVTAFAESVSNGRGTPSDYAYASGIRYLAQTTNAFTFNADFVVANAVGTAKLLPTKAFEINQSGFSSQQTSQTAGVTPSMAGTTANWDGVSLVLDTTNVSSLTTSFSFTVNGYNLFQTTSYSKTMTLDNVVCDPASTTLAFYQGSGGGDASGERISLSSVSFDGDFGNGYPDLTNATVYDDAKHEAVVDPNELVVYDGYFRGKNSSTSWAVDWGAQGLDMPSTDGYTWPDYSAVGGNDRYVLFKKAAFEGTSTVYKLTLDTPSTTNDNFEIYVKQDGISGWLDGTQSYVDGQSVATDGTGLLNDGYASGSGVRYINLSTAAADLYVLVGITSTSAPVFKGVVLTAV